MWQDGPAITIPVSYTHLDVYKRQVMFVAAAEGDGDMINGRGDAYCGMLNCSYNLGMRHLKGYIPEYPVGTCLLYTSRCV